MDLDMDPFRLIDVCSEDDCLLSSPSGFSENQNEDDYFDFLEGEDAEEMQGTEHLRGQIHQEPVSSERLEAEIPRKNSGCNLRKSLAWDKAFFTNEGVLDSEELSVIKNGANKTTPFSLPSIQEGIRTSADSNSTMDSDSLTLESGEVDLFEDVRASIQRSSKASKVDSLSSKKVMGIPGQKRAALGVSDSKKAVLPARKAMKPAAAPRKQSVTTKEMISRPSVVQPAPRSGEPNTSCLKPPKISGRANPNLAEPSKTTSVAGNRIKVDNSAKAASVAGKGGNVAAPKKPTSVRSSISSRLSGLPKSSLGPSPSATNMKSNGSCSSYSASGSTSSDSSAKSPLKSVRSKVASKSVIPVSGSTLRSSLRMPSRNRIKPENSRLSAYLKSIPKPNVTSIISPASSIDGLSSESSSSTSTVNPGPNDFKANAGINSPQRGRVNVGTDSPRKRSSLGRDSPASQASNPSQVSKSFKPSGLRMPSPKIGFFDADKTLVHTPTSSSQSPSGARSGLSKAGPRTLTLKETVKTKASKLQPERTVRSSDGIKLDAQGAKVVATKNPVSSEELRQISTDSTKLTCVSELVKELSSGTSRETQFASRSISEMPNAETVQDFVSSTGLCIRDNTALENDIVISFCKEDGPQISTELTDCHRNVMNLSKMPGEKTSDDQRHLKNDLHLLHKGNEKENYSGSDDQVNDLIRQMAAVDLNVDVVKEEEDLQKTSLKHNRPCLSPNPTKVPSSTRVPLADNVSFCNKSVCFESASESTIDISPSEVALPERIQKEDS